MSKLCRQVSIESPGPTLKECVFNFEVPVPEVPPHGARLRVAYAGACYRAGRVRSASVCSASSLASVGGLSTETEFGLGPGPVPGHIGVRDGALFPGYEVAGVVDALGPLADRSAGLAVGSRVILYPTEGVPAGYAEYMVVPDCEYLVPVPDELPLSVAATLPTGALLATNAVATAADRLHGMLQGPDRKAEASLLIVGTGGLALWALRLATRHFAGSLPGADRVNINVATLKDDALSLIKKYPGVRVVQWNEDLYERQLVERTLDACGGPVDLVINFGTTSRTLNRSLQCLALGGVVLVTEEVGERLLPKFAKKVDELGVDIVVVPNGSIEQLRELVALVALGQIEPPPHTVFPAEEAAEVVRKLCDSEIVGRALLRFHHVD